MSADRFPKSARLLKGKDFEFRPCRRFVTPSFRIFYTTGGSGRLGISISKKVLKNATSRNRVRRLAREAFRKNRARFDGLDLNLVGRSYLKENWNVLTESDVASEFEGFLSKVS